MQNSHGESQGDHNYVARRTRSTSSDDSSIESNNVRRRRRRLRRGQRGNTDHDYISLRALSEEDGDDAENEPNVEHIEEQANNHEEDNNVDTDVAQVDPVNDLPEEAHEMLGASLPRERRSDDEGSDIGII